MSHSPAFLLALSLAASTASTAAPMVPAGGGPLPSPPGAEGTHGCLLPEQRAAIQRRIEASVAQLRSSGLLPDGAPETGAAPTTLFDWPVRLAPGLLDAGAHGISNFVDHNPAIGAVQDFECLGRTYDIPGYNHAGTDIFSWPFPWYRMDHDALLAVAAAPGTLVLRDDGNFDRGCPGVSTTAVWNAVYVRHADGSVAWYGHLRKGSLLAKQIGDPIGAGEVLGTVGSSGFSTGPHLHFELHDPSGAVVDPWAGPCNPGVESWWREQRPYYDPAINKLATHSAPPVFPDCPQPEIPNLSDRFVPGQRVYFAAYYRDQQGGQPTHYRILRPDGREFDSWTDASSDPYYEASYWYWQEDLPTNALAGRWTFSAEFEGQTTEHSFTVGQGCVADAQTLCLLGGRFEARVRWHNQFSDARGSGKAQPKSDLSGFFYFTDPANVELVVKVLDFGDAIKVFYGELTNLEFSLELTDTTTGRTKSYGNTPGDCGQIDQSFDSGAAGLDAAHLVGPNSTLTGPCRRSPTHLCLLGGRIAVDVVWLNPYSGASGIAQAASLSSLTGTFSFDDARNVEILVKALDFGDSLRFFWGSLSDFRYDIIVTNTVTGQQRSYINQAGQFCGGLDNHAF